MKKVILFFAFFVSACGYDTPVAYEDKQGLEQVQMERDIVKQRQAQMSLEEYERMQRTNYYDYETQKRAKCSLGFGYDENGYPCDKNRAYRGEETNMNDDEQPKKRRVCFCEES